MATHPSEIATTEPVLPIAPDPAWEAEVKRVMGMVPDWMRRIAPSPWLRQVCLDFSTYRFDALPQRMTDIGFMVTSQENSCRYCYGLSRAMMRLLGYSDELITRIERDVQLAELDPRERVFIGFCRNLARSNPRPSRAARLELLQLGFSPLEVAEMAFMVADHSFGNRITTFLAVPPEASVEKMADSWLGKLMRPLIAKQLRKRPPPRNAPPRDAATLSPIARTLEGLPAAGMFQDALDAAFASPNISLRTKLLMFGVIARSLECPFCEAEVVQRLAQQGMPQAQVRASLESLADAQLDPMEEPLLAWARDTVRYQTLDIQKRTHALRERIGAERTLEAIGVAALANATVRLAMLLE
ncbi:carboxymuconolactone decarboxylase family protein [Ramlibacter albus]|uniref:Carboxymuconolactone decarboxylase family protein n=1 Tax=Ramlibacter albus TaxID=2079448 RepID=A0A923MAS7_9BURK|nr:hypothetical protein [Ramlibacter albus]MBC5765913.1 hypothetical protein [Ramlibacter albus]